MLTFPEPTFCCPLCGKPLEAQMPAFLDDVEAMRVYECEECEWEGIVRYTTKAELQEHYQRKGFAKGKQKRKGRARTGKQFKRRRI